MECRDCEEFLSDYVEGEIRGDARQYLEEHLSSCHTCYEKLHGVNQLRDILRSLRYRKPPTRLDFALQRLIRLKLCGRDGFLQRIRERLCEDRLHLLLAVVALLAVFFVTYKVLQGYPGLLNRSSRGERVFSSSVEGSEITNYVLERIAPSDLPFYASHDSSMSSVDSLSLGSTRYTTTHVGYVTF